MSIIKTKKVLKTILRVILILLILYLGYAGLRTYKYNHTYSITQKITYIVNHVNDGFPRSNKIILQSIKFKNNNVEINYGSGFDHNKIECIEYQTQHFFISLPTNTSSDDIWWQVTDNKGHQYICNNGILYTDEINKKSKKVKDKQLINLYHKEMKEFTDKFGKHMGFQIYNPWNN